MHPMWSSILCVLLNIHGEETLQRVIKYLFNYISFELLFRLIKRQKHIMYDESHALILIESANYYYSQILSERFNIVVTPKGTNKASFATRMQ